LVALELGFYGDAGGNKDKSNIAFGGYIATVDQWKAFKEPWSDEIEKEGIEYFVVRRWNRPFTVSLRKRVGPSDIRCPSSNAYIGS
jgi:hypothetical protein